MATWSRSGNLNYFVGENQEEEYEIAWTLEGYSCRRTEHSPEESEQEIQVVGVWVVNPGIKLDGAALAAFLRKHEDEILRQIERELAIDA